MNIDPNISILMVEDDEVDVMAFKRAINKAELPNQVFYAANGSGRARVFARGRWQTKN